MKHKYTQEEIEFIKAYTPGKSYKEIQAEFLKRFGWEITHGQLKGVFKKHGISTGRDGRFQKGYASPKKGDKLSNEQYAKSYPTMFKPGRRPQNVDPIGTEKMLADGYIWIKIDDKPKVKKQVNWKQKHRIIWEEAHGPIPEGYVITFLDGNRSNCLLENLAMIQKSTNVIMNKKKLHSENKELTKAGIAVATLMDKKYKRTKERKK